MSTLNRILATELTPKRAKLKVKLKSKVTNVDGGKIYNVSLLFGDDKYATEEKPVIKIESTPGHWFLSSLLGDKWSPGRSGDTISVYGDWKVTGMTKVLDEAERIVKNRKKS